MISIIAMTVVAFLRREVEGFNTNFVIGFGVATIIALSVGPALLETYRSSVRGMGDAALLATVAVLFGTGTWSRLTLLSVVVVGGGLMMWELRIAPDLS
jgi:chromate transport protein ChrA